MKGYTAKQDVEIFINKEVDLSDFEFERLASEIERYIDQTTGRNFKADKEATERLYNGNSSTHLSIDDCVEVTKVEIGLDDYGANFQEVFPLSPSNASGYFTLQAKDNMGYDVAIRQIGLRSRVFTSGVNNQRITAKWGYSVEPPDDIRLATTILLAGAYNANKGGTTGSVKSEKIGNYSVTYADEKGSASWNDYERAVGILNSYKKWNI